MNVIMTVTCRLGRSQRSRACKTPLQLGEARAEAQQAGGRGRGVGQWQVDPRDEGRRHRGRGSSPLPPRWLGGACGRAAAGVEQCRSHRGNCALELPTHAPHLEGGTLTHD